MKPIMDSGEIPGKELRSHTEEYWDRRDKTAKVMGLAQKTNWTGLQAGRAC